MKSIESLQTEVNELLALDRNELSKTKSGVTQLRKARKRVPFLNQCLQYLESSPEESFIKKEIARIEKIIQNVSDRFVAAGYKDLTAEKKARKEFLKEYGIPKMKEQLKTLKFILK